MNIHWIVNHPANYLIYLFNNIGYTDLKYSLTVHFLYSQSYEHEWKKQKEFKFNFRYCSFNGIVDPRLIRLVLSEKNSFFIVSNWNGPFIIILLFLLALSGRKYALWSDTPNVNKPRSFLKKFIRTRWLNFIAKRASVIMGTGQSAIEAYKSMNFDKDKLVNFPFFTDLDLFVPLKIDNYSNKYSEKLVLFSSGRLSIDHKGYDIALYAIHKFIQDSSFRNVIYYLAGTGKDEYKLRKIAEQLGISQHVVFLGWLEEDQLQKYYELAHIFLHPSHFDPYPNAVLEAMACGLVVIGSDKAGSVIDRIVNFENGLIHKDGNFEQISSYLSFLHNNPDQIEIIGAAARRTSEEWPIEKARIILKNVLEKVS